LIHGGLMPRLLRLSTKSADTVMCLNSEEARYLVEHDWALRERITVLANHAPEGFFIQRNYRNRATQLLFVGQWLPMKGTQILVSAFTRLCRFHSDLRLCCAGTIESSKSVLENFPEDVRHAISVYPSVSEDELLDLHRAADIFVLPTLSEGFSLALTEAMSSALPIITTPVGAAPDILTDKCSALFIPAMDANALVTAVTTLLDDPSLRSELGQNVQAAAQGLLPEPTMQDFAFCLESLAQGSGQNVVQSPPTATRGAWWN
jgi:glycosyltransferase involved in cell wall biosynthesis